MSETIHKCAAKILALNQDSSDEERSEGEKMLKAIAKLGQSPAHQVEAVAALKAIIDEGIGLDFIAAEHLSELASDADFDYLREKLYNDRYNNACLQAMLRLRGRDAYSDAIDFVANSELDGNTRLGALETLSEHSGNPFHKLVPDRYWNHRITDERLPLDVLRKWRDDGYPKFEIAPITIPEERLRQAGVTLPDEYAKFLLKHDGFDRLEFDDIEWELTVAAELFEPVDVDGTEYPAIGILVSYVAGMRDAIPDDHTVDAKGRPYSLDRIAGGIAIGHGDSGDILYLDPTDGHSAWIFHPDGGDVEKVGKSFTAWKRKTRRV